MQSRERFLAALRGDALDRPPVWLMRQAGRYLPGYRALRAEHSFWDVCQKPELSTRAALEPLDRFALDAAIVFSDILVVPLAMGLGVSFGPGEGPRIARPLRSGADYDAWQLDGVLGRIDYLPRAVAHLKATLGDRYGILGFAGAPFTLFAYCVEGGGSDDFRAARTLMHRDPQLARRALATIADVVGDLLLAQVDAGADAVQLFDSWGGLLAPDEYRDFALPALQRITAKLKPRNVPTLLFVRGGHHLLPLLGDSGVTGLSLDWRTEWQYARDMYPQHVLQGNIDPVLLLGDAGVVRRRTRELLEVMKRSSAGRRCILNLGHGILPGTPPETVAAMVETAAEFA
ncbi:MAG TPA: uroporphyrinogen decarboxylase [Steroidobacteraceae bacterium]|nr:uroporphyrinogen decarboxylase [Steroidobacteraceae bacterium]